MLRVSHLLACLALYRTAVVAGLKCPDGLSGWLLRPTTVDADGNVTGTCYYMSSIEANWDAGQSACAQFSEVASQPVFLVSVHSLYENVFVFDNATNKRSAWLGLNQKRFPGDWEWDDGTRFDYDLWLAGSPSVDGDCVSQARPLDTACGEWVNADCDIPLHYVCETAAIQADTENIFALRTANFPDQCECDVHDYAL